MKNTLVVWSQMSLHHQTHHCWYFPNREIEKHDLSWTIFTYHQGFPGYAELYVRLPTQARKVSRWIQAIWRCLSRSNSETPTQCFPTTMKYTSQSGIIKKSIRNTKSFQPVQQLAGFVASIPLPVKNSQAVLDGWLKNPPWNITGGMVPLKSTRSIYLSIYLSIYIYLYIWILPTRIRLFMPLLSWGSE